MAEHQPSEDLQGKSIEEREEWRADDLLPPVQSRIWPLWMPLAVYFVAIFVSSFAALLRYTGVDETPLQLIGLLLQDGLWIVLPILIACIGLRHPPSVLGLAKPQLKSALLAIPAGIFFYLMNTSAAMLIELIAPGKIAESTSALQLVSGANNALELLIAISFICVLGPIAEEMLFRAFLYPPLLHHFKRPLAIVLCAAAFALAHMSSWLFFPLFIGGLGFTWLYDKYRNLWVNIIAHASWNTVVIILFMSFNG
jgi:membrane protease YdiL (CAAX protease family)